MSDITTAVETMHRRQQSDLIELRAENQHLRKALGRKPKPTKRTIEYVVEHLRELGYDPSPEKVERMQAIIDNRFTPEGHRAPGRRGVGRASVLQKELRRRNAGT